MSFRMFLKMNGKEFPIYLCRYAVIGATNQSSRPIKDPSIYIRLEATGDPTFWDWCAQGEKRDGEIVIPRSDAEGILKIIAFENGFVKRYLAIYSDGMLPIESITISAEKIQPGAPLENNLPE